VTTASSKLKDEYYRGEYLVAYITIMNERGGSKITIRRVNITIWRIEKRYEKWRNIEVVYNKTINISEGIEGGQAFSMEIKVKLDFNPARYNITIAVYSTATGSPHYPVRGHRFWVRSAIEIPPIVWAVIVDALFILVAVMIYRRMR